MAITFITLIITNLQPDDMRLLIEFVLYLAKLLDKFLPITLKGIQYVSN